MCACACVFLLSVVRFFVCSVMCSALLVGWLDWLCLEFLSILYVCESKYTMTDVTTVDVMPYRVLNFQMYLSHSVAYRMRATGAVRMDGWQNSIKEPPKKSIDMSSHLVIVAVATVRSLCFCFCFCSTFPFHLPEQRFF